MFCRETKFHPKIKIGSMREIFKQKTSGNKVNTSLANECGLSLEFLEILNLRGIDTKEKIEDFLAPSISKMSCPFDIDNMKEATVRIQKAIEAHERILIYGDYDCDGICAISILMLYFRSQNANATYFIPNRNSEGYGMSVETLSGILESDKPDLVVTVDCGVTAVDEVQFLLDNGVDVIVTDHHEPQEKLPNCIIVDPKIARKDFFEFCGAGVALKLVEALSSRDEAEKYLDIAAIATIADIVPLMDENRIIAYHGIKELNKKMRKGVEMLLGSKSCNSYDIMYKLAPKINAAGRMDCAMKAVDLFLSDDHFLLEGLTKDLNRDNVLRQQTCEDVVRVAKEKLQSVDFSNCSIIILYDESWEAGTLGIAASRLVETFNRPAILFTLKDGEMRGSARSIKEVNIFETLSKFSTLFSGFGGHAQAAGVSIKECHFEEFKTGINELMNFEIKKEELKKTVEYDLQIELKDNLIPFAKELEKLEPTGFTNPKPVFKLVANNLKFERIGLTNHIKSVMRGIEVIGFGKYEQMLSAKCDSEFEVLLSRNIFQNNEYAQIILRSIYIKEVQNLSDNELLLCSLHQLSHLDVKNEVKKKNKIATMENVGENTLDKKIIGDIDTVATSDNISENACKKSFVEIDSEKLNSYLKNPIGTLVVCYSLGGLSKLKAIAPNLPVSIGLLSNQNPENQIILCPSQEFDFRFFNRVVFFEISACEGYNQYIAKSNTVEVLKNANVFKFETIEDDLLRSVFVELRKMAESKMRMPNLDKMLKMIKQKLKITKYQLALSLQIFTELHLISTSERGIIEVSNQRTELMDSATYRNIK